MLTASRLTELLGSDDVLAFTTAGNRIPVPAELRAGAATIVVSAPSDALKTVSDRGFIEGSVDRGEVWTAEAFVLNSEVVKRLEGEFLTPADVYEAVASLGYEWIVSPSSSAP